MYNSLLEKGDMSKMKKSLKVVTGLVLSMAMSVPSNLVCTEGATETFNLETSSQNIIEVEKNVNYQFHMLLQNNDDWKGSNIVLEKVLFDSNQEISAYLYYVVKNENNIGYLIVSADNPNYIIEFGKDLFLDSASDEVYKEYYIKEKNQKTYYLGGISYVIGGNNKKNEKIFVDVSTDNIEEISEKQLGELEISEEQKSLSSPPDSEGDGFITSPGTYESGYDSSVSKNVKNYDITYKKMSELQSGGVCAPTAATNLMLYWYKRNKSKYKKLCYKSSWIDTFKEIRDYMKWTKENGTKDKNLATGYSDFLDLVGFKNYTVKYHSGTDNGRKIASEIDKGRPCHLVVHSHYKYGDHSVLAVGYKQYKYEHWYGDRYETYIRIADGWISSPTRFVWGKCKGDWNYVTVIIN